jgi:hypothetical protein
MRPSSTLVVLWLTAPPLFAGGCSEGTGSAADVPDLHFSVLETQDSVPGDSGVGAQDVPLELEVEPNVCGAEGGGDPGCACIENDECYSGFCVAGAGGQVCAATCETKCPAGLSCQQVANPAGDPVFVCLDRHLYWCRPCSVAADCKHPSAVASSDQCLDSGDGSGSFCATACHDDADCPASAVCEAADDGKSYCRPETGECSCSALAIQRGASTTCERVNEHGVCRGSRVCGEAGLSACDAEEPQPEVCSGKDEDCDGITDEALPLLPCTVESAVGVCAGVRACSEGTYTLCDAPVAVEESCNAADDDCDGVTDEELAAVACVVEQGAVKCAGTRDCEGGAWSECDAPAAAPEQCNGVDDDCDGATDEAFADLGLACDGPDGDQCATGVLACAANGGTTCTEAASGGHVETCNAIDDDCDGVTDEEFVGLGAACDGVDLDSCTEGVAACGPDGQTTCVEAASLAKVEVCNGEDDDCDGVTDEEFAELGASCDGDDADACDDGHIACAVGGVTVCEEPEGTLKVELCNGNDDDCDGATDEGFAGLGQACDGPDADECESGVIACAGDGQATCNELPDGGKVEACNGNDDDCDGATDEAFPTLGTECDGGDTDKCEGGVVVCATNGGTRCDEPLGPVIIEKCDGLDNDCDAATDESWTSLGEPCDGIDTDKCAYGVIACNPSGQGVLCNEPSGLGVAETCNAFDDDCDGQVDEEFAQLGKLCDGLDEDLCPEGVYVCAPDETLACSEPEFGGHSESCNGLDDDCDGIADEDFPVTQTCDDSPWHQGCGAGSLVCTPDGESVTCEAWAIGTDLMTNGDFSGIEDLEEWPDFGLYIEPGLPAVSASCAYDASLGCKTGPAAKCTFTQPAEKPWFYTLQYTGLPVTEGQEYVLKLCARGSTAGQKLRVGVQEHTSPADVFPAVTFALEAGAWECRRFPFVALASFADAKVTLQLGDASAGPVWIDDVRLECVDPSCAKASAGAP